MVVCKFGGGGIETINNGAEITFNLIPTLGGVLHQRASASYDNCLEATFQICKTSCDTDIQEISATEFRQLTRWLNRKEFKKLKILDQEHIDIYWEASFNINRIEIDGKLMGLELQAVTNRPFALKEPKTFIIQARYKYTWERFYKDNGSGKGKSTGKYVTSYNRDFYPDDGVSGAYYYVFVKQELDSEHSINDTSYEEGYIYPNTKITVLDNGNLKIHNAIENRDTYIANVSAGEIIIMDYPIIQSSDSSHNIQNDFNWNFLRIANTFKESRNDLTISLPCTIELKYSPIVKVGL